MERVEDIPDLALRADQAAASGDLKGARSILVRLAPLASTVETWLKLGAICRADGDFNASLDAINQGLALAPLDFMGLLSRAMLLEKMDDPEADEAFGRALAQRPDTLLGPTMARMVAHAEERFGKQVQARTNAMALAMAAPAQRATPGEALRLARFRSNAVRQTRPYHSDPTHFHFPGLIEREFHDAVAFPWLSDLDTASGVIASEFERVAAAERAELVPYIQYAAHEPLGQWRALNHSRDWLAIHLIQNGRVVEANARHCPQTMAVLAQLPQPQIAGCSPNVMFSLLAPGAVIPPHTGVTNTRLVCHVPLIVPEGCWFRVGAETRPWHVGKSFVFDDTIEHEAANPSHSLRVVMIFDIWHPGLSVTERDAITLMLEAEAGGASLAL